MNGFDENAVEAALQLKESVGANVTVVSVGSGFVMDVMKKPLSMGADALVLVDDPLVTDLDAFATAVALAEAIRKVGDFDLVLCGRQASDWDNAMVPLGVAELLGLPCVTLAQKIEARDDGGITVHRALSDGYEVVDARLPALGHSQQRAWRTALPHSQGHHDRRTQVPNGLERVGPESGRIRANTQAHPGRSVHTHERQALRVDRGRR